MTINKTHNSDDIFSESVVVDYVAGHLKGTKAQAHFEKMLASSDALQKAVERERQLRNALTAYEHNDSKQNPIGDEGVNRLLAQLDELDAGQIKNQAANSKAPSSMTSHNWFTVSGVAASIVLATVLFVGFQANQTTSDFTLLSDTTEKATTAQLDFNDLVKARRVAQLWFVDELPPQQVFELFTENQLTPISRAGHAWVVKSSEVLSNKQLERLEALAKIKRVSLISNNTHTGTVDK